MRHKFTNPIITDDRGADHGDPFVMKYLDTYYLYHTGRFGVHVYTSPDLVAWEYNGLAVEASTDERHWAQRDLWAPEVMYDRGTFYMYVAGTQPLVNGHSDDHARRQGIARSSDPLGPFVWDDEPLIDEWSIDGHPFRDRDGSLWLYYNIRTDATSYHDGTTGCGNVVQRLAAPDRLAGPQLPVAFPTERWEGNALGDWYWNEGPFVLKRRGVYYQMFSGGWFGDDTYGVGFSTAPAPDGPWTKYAANPILRSNEHILGPGHHSVTRAPNGVTPYAVYHGYVPGQKGRKVHADRLFWVGDRLHVAGPTAHDQPLPPAPCYDEAVPHWYVGAWVRGTACNVAGEAAPLPLPTAQFHHVEGTLQNGQLQVYVDGVLLTTYESKTAEPQITSDGEVRALMRTSWLDDDDIHELPPGAQRRWVWGGSGPLDVSLAVKGVAVVTVPGTVLEQTHVETDDGYRHVHFQLPHGATFIEVRAGSGGAIVTDVVLTALG